MTGKMPVLRDGESFEFVGAGLADKSVFAAEELTAKPAPTEFSCPPTPNRGATPSVYRLKCVNGDGIRFVHRLRHC
jgi:hypothetical protein